jgi:hypothetical protein
MVKYTESWLLEQSPTQMKVIFFTRISIFSTQRCSTDKNGINAEQHWFILDGDLNHSNKSYRCLIVHFQCQFIKEQWTLLVYGSLALEKSYRSEVKLNLDLFLKQLCCKKKTTRNGGQIFIIQSNDKLRNFRMPYFIKFGIAWIKFNTVFSFVFEKLCSLLNLLFSSYYFFFLRGRRLTIIKFAKDHSFL